MGQFYAIFRNTLLETVRQPVYALVLVLLCGLIALMPAFSAQIYTFGAGSGLEQSAERLIADLGLASVLLAGLILAVFTSVTVLTREIDNKTALTVLSKKVARPVFVLAKYAGVAVGILLAAFTGTVTILLTMRIGPRVAVSDPLDYGVIAGMLLAALLAVGIATGRNYFSGRAWVGSFTLSFVVLMAIVFCVFLLFDKEYEFVLTSEPAAAQAGLEGDEGMHSPEDGAVVYDWEVARAAVLTVQAVLLMAGVAVAASTRLQVGGTAAVSLLVFLGGLTSNYFHGQAVRLCAQTEGASWADQAVLAGANLWRALLPDLQTFWMSDALTREHPIPFDYLFSASAYAILYVLAMLFLAAFLFQRREVS